MTEYGIFDDHGQIERQIYGIDAARERLHKTYMHEQCWFEPVCPEHRDHAIHECPACNGAD